MTGNISVEVKESCASLSIERQPSFVKNTLILTAAGVLARGLGAVYRIFLSRVIQDEGMGLYQMAYNVFAVIITISLMGFPLPSRRLWLKRRSRRIIGVPIAFSWCRSHPWFFLG
jgi:hypothetical protein